jgi:rubrerythrin
MPEFLNPFTGVVPGRKLTHSELVRALRLDLSAEQEAVHLYLSHADATDNELAKKVLTDIADEERVHAGEFQRLINILLSDEEALLKEGAQEVNQIAKESDASVKIETSESEMGGNIPTVGNLKKCE